MPFSGGRHRRPSAATACWTAPSRGFHFYCQFETGTSDLVLKREPYKLSFTLVQRLRETSCPFRANGSPTLLNITEVRSRDAKKLGELGGDVKTSTPDAFASWLTKAIGEWGEVVKAENISLD